ncbi:hypothetical protein Adt_31588 [Abeliophyllum distichum]|uniref:Uncharacterized protein n=1 Tax=Abeliophyllum distichum TaxID=126358 RepID=A0ABD1RFW9_9LAMI
MAVDKNLFLQPIDINMVSPNLDKLDLSRFMIVIDNGGDEPRHSAFERFKGKAVMNEMVNSCARFHKEIVNVTRSYEQLIRIVNATSFHPFRGQIRPFYGKQYGSF